MGNHVILPLGGEATTHAVQPHVEAQASSPHAAIHHVATIDAVAKRFGTHLRHGLSHAAVHSARQVHGHNELPPPKASPWWRRLAAQFNDLVIWILLGAAILSLATAEWLDGLVILAIVVLNAGLAFLQEDRAGRALLALQSLAAPKAKVVREGQAVTVAARELVPGDRVEIEAGDHVPADLRLMDASELHVDESPLTGESAPVGKAPSLTLHATTPLAERLNMAFMGTSVTRGNAAGIVVATGERTELGQIAQLISRQTTEKTPLQVQLAGLSRVLIAVILALVATMFIAHFVRGGNFIEVLLLSVSVAVAAVPEGMPAVVTVALAIGLRRMARRNALIRRLPSVETLGCVNVICSDKTGTLTRNEMTVREIILASSRLNVSGTGYIPLGEFTDERHNRHTLLNDIELHHVLTAAAWCNHAHVAPSDKQENKWNAIGDPTEAALMVVALKAGIATANEAHHFAHEIPFDSDRKAMSVVVEEGDRRMMYSKGAPEAILRLATHEQHDTENVLLTDDRRKELLQASTHMAERALRVLALASRPVTLDEPIVENGLILLGLIGMIDPPRDEVRTAVAKCHAAGIRPVMITGDHPATALAIAKELGIAPADADLARVVTGVDLDQLDDGQLESRLDDVTIFARVTAANKLRIVDTLKRRGDIVAMTGDGVNDAPAVKAADIGIAMGITGTDVTKAASDMVLTDDNFTSIVAAVEEGRSIYRNIRQFIHYLLASNASELMVMLVGALMGWPAPLLALHILWINLVTDSLPALAIAVEPPAGDLMRQPPRNADEPLLSWRKGGEVIFHGSLMTATALAVFHAAYGGAADNLSYARTVAFTTLALSQLFFAFGCRGELRNAWQLGFFNNRPLVAAVTLGCLAQFALVTLPGTQQLFHLQPLSMPEWVGIVVIAMLPVTFVELQKLGREAA